MILEIPSIKLYNLIPGAPGSGPSNFYSFSGDLYFEAQGDGVGREIYRLSSCPADFTDECTTGPCDLTENIVAGNIINLTGHFRVPSGQNLVLSAGNSTTLEMGFEVQQNGILEVNSDGCN